MSDSTTCPRCGNIMPHPAGMNALSRWDNKTEVCPQCGADEAMAQFAAHTADPGNREAVAEAVHPIRGAVPWVALT